MVPWTDEGNFTFFGTIVWPFFLSHFYYKCFFWTVGWCDDCTCLAGDLSFFMDDERIPNSREIRVLSFESIWVPQKKGFSKKSPHPLQHKLVSSEVRKSWRIESSAFAAGIEELGRNSSILGSWDALRTWKASQMEGEVLLREEAARWQHV